MRFNFVFWINSFIFSLLITICFVNVAFSNNNTIYIQTHPKNAKVYIDGDYKGKSSLQVLVNPGKYKIVIQQKKNEILYYYEDKVFISSDVSKKEIREKLDAFDTNEIKDCNNYLNKYPNGKFALEIREQKTKLISKHPGYNKTVTPARATWYSGYFLEALVSRGLEQLGYEVKDPKRKTVPMFYKDVISRKVDFWANGWFPLHYEQLPDDFNKKARIVSDIVENGAIQGYLVSKKHAEKYDITSINDFKREEVKKVFDANGDGKADLIACPSGWGCEKIISHHMKDEYYGLNKFINTIKQINYPAIMEDEIERYYNGEAIFFYTWTPNWILDKLKLGEDVVFINVPEIKATPFQQGLEDAMVVHNLEGAVSDPIKFGFVANDICTVANKDFLIENQVVERFLSMIDVQRKDINAQNAKMHDGEDKKRDIERHVKNWIENHQKNWNKWLEEARKVIKYKHPFI